MLQNKASNKFDHVNCFCNFQWSQSKNCSMISVSFTYKLLTTTRNLPRKISTLRKLSFDIFINQLNYKLANFVNCQKTLIKLPQRIQPQCYFFHFQCARFYSYFCLLRDTYFPNVKPRESKPLTRLHKYHMLKISKLHYQVCVIYVLLQTLITVRIEYVSSFCLNIYSSL